MTRVWLLLFDLNLRHFTRRDPEETKKKDILYEDANLLCKFFCQNKFKTAFNNQNPVF